MEKSENQNRFSVLTIRLTMEEHSRIVDAAWRQRRSASSLLRQASEEYLYRLEETKKLQQPNVSAVSN